MTPSRWRTEIPFQSFIRQSNQKEVPDGMDKQTRGERNKRSAGDIALIGAMVALIEVSKVALGFMPNIELTSFWIILFTLFFRWRILFAVPVFIFIEGAFYGFGLWWVMYLYAWPLLAGLAWLFRKQKSVWFWSIFSSAFGLSFGFLCAIPYVVIGMTDSGWLGGLQAGFVWWVAGIPWDIAHGVGNFVLMLMLYRPVCKAMERASVRLSLPHPRPKEEKK